MNTRPETVVYNTSCAANTHCTSPVRLTPRWGIKMINLRAEDDDDVT